MSSEWRSCWRGTTWTMTRRAWGKLRTPARKLRSRPKRPPPLQQGIEKMQMVLPLHKQQVRSQPDLLLRLCFPGSIEPYWNISPGTVGI